MPMCKGFMTRVSRTARAPATRLVPKTLSFQQSRQRRRLTMADVTKITSGSLIAADQVNGTNVYNMEGEKLGTVDDIMIDKISGKAIYAVMSFGGFLGIGE